MATPFLFLVHKKVRVDQVACSAELTPVSFMSVQLTRLRKMIRVGLQITLWSIWIGVACGFATAGESPKDRLAKAEAMFQERCKTAGEKIYRTVENVEGIFLMKLRPEEINYGDQFRMDDPYGRDLVGDGYIKSFLYRRTTRGSITFDKGAYPGYSFIEAIDPVDGKRYRFTGVVRPVGKKDASTPNIQAELRRNPNFDLNNYAFVLEKVRAPEEMPRYGITYEDISTREDRDYWIAGGALKVIDLQTNELIAERIGYMMDRGQGNNSGGRSPWLLAESNACPPFPVAPGNHPFKLNQTRNFVEKILQIKGGK